MSATAARRDRLRAVLEEKEAEAALVTRLVNVRYLTGFTGSNAALLVTRDAAVLATDGRYLGQSLREAPDVERVITRDLVGALTKRATADGVRRLAIEEHEVSIETYDAMQRRADALSFGRLGRAVEHLRQVKDDEELALLHRACAIADSALADIIPGLAPGRTERSIARELESRMLDHGGEAASFPTIVAAGVNSATPHHSPTDAPVQPGDLLKIDFGATYGGYHSDCTRTYVVGAEPKSWQADLHALVREAQRAGRHALAPGADAKAVDAAARGIIERAGYGEQFPHGLGHGVGLEIHEEPLLAESALGRLADRTPVTVEPGIYLEGRGGVRIEDTLVVRAAGAGGPELLTRSTRDLLVLG